MTSLISVLSLIIYVLFLGKATAFVHIKPALKSPEKLSSEWRFQSSLFLSSAALPRLSQNDLNELDSNGYVIVENFLPVNLQEDLRTDVKSLRENFKFNIAKIGQDSTNTLNTDIRVAETCFLGPNKLSDQPNASRSQLYTILDQLRQEGVQTKMQAQAEIEADRKQAQQQLVDAGREVRRLQSALMSSS